MDERMMVVWWLELVGWWVGGWVADWWVGGRFGLEVWLVGDWMDE